MKKILLIVLMSLFLCSFASAALSKTASYLSTANGNDYPTGANYYAQTFLPNVTGYASIIELYSDANGPITVSLREVNASGQPLGTSLESINVALTGGTGLFNVTFSNSTTITSGTTYAIVFNGSGSGSLDYHTPGGYGSGAKYTSSDSGANWGGAGTVDYIFAVYVSDTGSSPPSAYNVTINLLSPANGETIASTSKNFTALLNITGAADKVWKNYTIHIWNSSEELFGEDTYTISGQWNATIFEATGFNIGNFYWNIFGCYGNATFSNCTWSPVNYTFNLGATLNSLVYNPNIFETTHQLFYANYSLLPDSEISQVKLVYNGTNYTVTNISIIDNNLVISKDIDIPANPSIFANTTKDFYFIFTYGGGVEQNSGILYQNVSFINLQLCNATWGAYSLNFTLKDENTETKIDNATSPVTFMTTFKYWLGYGSTYKNYSYQIINNSSANSFQFCIYPYNSSITFKSDMDTEYTAYNYADNEYHLRNATLTNVTTNFDLFLYLLQSAQATKFYIKAKEGIDFIQDAIVTVSKYFIGEGVYKTVSIRVTDSTGSFPMYMDIDGKYRFSVVKNGEVLGIIDRTATCASAPCSMDLMMTQTAGSIWEGYGNTYAVNVVSNISFNHTSKIFSYNFYDTTGLANYFRFEVTKTITNMSGSLTICNTTVYSTFGSITCDVSNYTGNFLARGFISRSPEVYDAELGAFVDLDVIEKLGMIGVLLNFGILLTLVLVAAVASRGSPSAIMFALGLGMIILKLLTIFPFSWYVVGGLEAIIIYILIKIKV